MPVPDDESSDDDEEDIFARPVEAVEAVWSDDDDETRRFATSPRARDFTLGTPAGTRIAFATDDGSEGEAERVHRGGQAVGDVGNGSTSGVGGEDETTAKRRRVSRDDARPAAAAAADDARPVEDREGEEEREEDGCESAALARSRMLLEDFDELARPPAPTYVPAARPAQTVDDESESESEDGVREYDAGNDATGTADADVDVGRRINLVFQAPNGERFTRGAGERETFARVVDEWRNGFEWTEVALAMGSDKVRIVFEGDAVRGDETPGALGLEDDDILELLPG